MNRDLRRLLHEAKIQKDPFLKLSLLQEGERMAEYDTESLFLFRMDISDGALWAGKPEVGLLAFTWCLKSYDDNVNLGSYFKSLISVFSRVTFALALHHQVTLAQLDNLLQEMESRLKRNNCSMRAHIQLSSTVTSLLGQQARSFELTQRWMELPRDEFCSNEASEANFILYQFVENQMWEQALLAAKPIVDGSMEHSRTPMCAYPVYAKSLWHLGEKEEARLITDEAVRITEGRLDCFGEMYELIENYVLFEEINKGIELFERRSSWLKFAPNPLDTFRYFAAVTCLLDQARQVKPDLLLRVSELFLTEHNLPDNKINTLRRFVYDEAMRLGTAFNHRNKNAYWTEYYGQAFRAVDR